MKVASKYEPLYQFLIRNGRENLTLNFTEIEELIGCKLPDSSKQRSWWSNRKNALQASAWIEAGYKVEKLDITKKRVTFCKPQATYIVQQDKTGIVLWNGQIIKALRQHMGLTQAEFAQELGVRQQTISEWEQGVYIPTRATAKHLMLVAEQANFKLEK